MSKKSGFYTGQVIIAVNTVTYAYTTDIIGGEPRFLVARVIGFISTVRMDLFQFSPIGIVEARVAIVCHAHDSFTIHC